MGARMVGQGDPLAVQNALHIGQLFLQISEGECELLALVFHLALALQSDSIGPAQLRLLLIPDGIEIEKLTDFLQAESEAFATQNKRQPRAVPFGEEPL